MDDRARRTAARYLNETGQVTTWPAKRKKKLCVLEYLAQQFEFERQYEEREVNALLNHLHTFEDHALLRRELFDQGFLDRVADGSRYWRPRRPDDPADLSARLIRATDPAD